MREGTVFSLSVHASTAGGGGGAVIHPADRGVPPLSQVRRGGASIPGQDGGTPTWVRMGGPGLKVPPSQDGIPPISRIKVLHPLAAGWGIPPIQVPDQDGGYP